MGWRHEYGSSPRTLACDRAIKVHDLAIGRLITGNDRRTTITTHWTEFHCRTNMHEGDICAFYFRRKTRRIGNDRAYRL